MKCDIAKLHSKGSLTSLKMNLLVLIMQLIVLSKHISSWPTSVRSNRPDELADLNDCIRRQMV
jgi:hypothetical protein